MPVGQLLVGGSVRSTHRALARLKLMWWALSVPSRVRAHGVQVGGGVRFFGMPIVSMAEASTIELQDEVVLCSVPEMTALGVSHPVVLRTLAAGAGIKIGRNTGISGGSICSAKSVSVGEDCLIGADVIITDTDFHARTPIGRRNNNRPEDVLAAPVVIGDNVFIGAGAIVLKGVTIGRNSIVGAGAVVSKSVPPDSVVCSAANRLLPLVSDAGLLP